MTFLEKAEEFVNNGIQLKQPLTDGSLIVIRRFAFMLDNEFQRLPAGTAFVLHKREDGLLELVQNEGAKGE